MLRKNSHISTQRTQPWRVAYWIMMTLQPAQLEHFPLLGASAA